jgi:phage-related holin
VNITQILSQFATDKQLAVVLVLVVADFILGVLAAVKAGTFRLTYISNFARNDVLGKVVPWFAIFALSKASSDAGIVGPIDWNQANVVVFGLVTAAMAGSILSSIADLGFPITPALSGHAVGSAPVVVQPPE